MTQAEYGPFVQQFAQQQQAFFTEYNITTDE
jgi:hypothetical protein